MSGFAHGVHPPDNKHYTEKLPIRRYPFPRRVVLPLSQHIGAPSRALVAVGDRVQRGQLIANPGGFVSTALHASVTGTVVEIAPYRVSSGALVPSIVIETDPFDAQRLEERPPLDPSALNNKDFVQHIQMAGIVGLGGAAFPSHVKYAVPEGKRIEHLVINGAECEPFLTCDHRVMLESPEQVMGGIAIVAERLGVRSTHVGIEDNKPDAVEALRRAGGGKGNIQVDALHVKYPQGAEKMLIKAIHGREVPAGKLPLELGMVVNNVGTMAAIYDYFQTGKPLIERVLTVTGPGVAEPANLLVPLGTSVREILEYCGIKPEVTQVIMGGPMMGQPLAELDVPVQKGTSGLLVLTKAGMAKEYACIRCGRCLEACPELLNPQLLAKLARGGRWEETESRAFVFDCIECGSCSYACPSGIPIVQLIKTSKAELRKRQRAK
ncbi:MAG: electron transport complex subunit RsxC [Deltaproteobacteria bacterium]|nr:electron transport complex subunit RsxC [Deltaproteobacteria bacterium]